ncbi:MAG TPA: L,D-transpeptidase family protein [Geomonas sp.]|nr:L,D-transpeptidase family protein [Geomonas sp.]
MAALAVIGKKFRLFSACVLMAPVVLAGCSHLQAKSSFEEADNLFRSGRYQDSLHKYEQIVQNYPDRGDAALFEMGIINSNPKNDHQDLDKSLECFQKIIKNYPGSSYRQDSEMMMFYINNVPIKDRMIAKGQREIDALQRDVSGKGSEIITLQRKIRELEQQLVAFAIKHRTVDKVVIDKKDRQLMVFSRGEVLKTYRIALGGDPIGPKERFDDDKTPEGAYLIDSRNMNSKYHLSLHISYPNESDRRRARKLGVSPGGDIMIHGLKKGLSWVGEAHREVDWTKGCIAVTDEEIEEIAKLVPNGTPVVINP